MSGTAKLPGVMDGITWSAEIDRKRYLIRRHAPHYTGAGEVVARGIEFREEAKMIASAPDLYAALEAAKDRANKVYQMGDAETRRALADIYELARLALAQANPQEGK